MLELQDLVSTAQGRELLAQGAMFTDPVAFAAALLPSASSALHGLAEVPRDGLLVHCGQQVCTDYAPSTLTKFAAAAALAPQAGVEPVVLWQDADRADSERFGIRFVLPKGDHTFGIPLASRATSHQELRFAALTSQGIDEAARNLRNWLTGWMKNRAKPERIASTERLDRLCEVMRAGGPGEVLGEFNARVAEFLLADAYPQRLPTVQLSRMLGLGLLTESLERYITHVDDVVKVFNETVTALIDSGVDPQLHLLGDDYLPLNFSCPNTGRRTHMVRETAGGRTLAVARCDCKEEQHTFDLGHGRSISLDALVATGRWSPDVSAPLHCLHLSSGWVVGRSSALYGIVLNAVAERALGLAPNPGLVPPAYVSTGGGEADEHSLLVRYLTR
ncbi:hypothetical protein [Streptomyces sp. NPDC057910]|uniref:hypothetical protein n=1 Tax=Streptomyces sp. NPDC057910 TaxID=3346278 RepID=UPI0036E8DD82